MVRLENVSKAFGDKTVLSGFSYEFGEGARYVITGSSGVGKTTRRTACCRGAPCCRT